MSSRISLIYSVYLILFVGTLKNPACSEPDFLCVEPEIVIMNRTSYLSVIHVTVLDKEGNPVPWIPVDFHVDDPMQITFPYPRAFTNEYGRATNVIRRMLETPRDLDASFGVAAGKVQRERIAVRGTNYVEDGAPFGFFAEGLRPFRGPSQVLTGYVGFFLDPLPIGSKVEAWSIDPTIAEPNTGTIITSSADDEQKVRFVVYARKHGGTVFIIDTLDVALYAATVAGDLNPPFVRGDVNNDNLTDVSDAIRILSFLFTEAEVIPCENAADANDDDHIDISDAITILFALFVNGNPIPSPSAACGADPTQESLGCDTFFGCQ